MPAVPAQLFEADAHAATTRELIDLTRRRFEESVRFQHTLAVFLMQVTGLVETRDRSLGGTHVRNEIVQMRARMQELERDIQRAEAPPAPPAPSPDAPRPGVRRGQQKIAALERERDGSLASFVSRDVVEHLDATELLRYLSLLFQKLQPGAQLVIHAINGASWAAFFGEFIRDTTRENILRPDTLQRCIEHAGFTGVTITFASAPPERLPKAPEQPEPELQPITDIINAHADRLNSRLFGALTYTVTALR